MSPGPAHTRNPSNEPVSEAQAEHGDSDAPKTKADPPGEAARRRARELSRKEIEWDRAWDRGARPREGR
jgi:hypothetical protein